MNGLVGRVERLRRVVLRRAALLDSPVVRAARVAGFVDRGRWSARGLMRYTMRGLLQVVLVLVV